MFDIILLDLDDTILDFTATERKSMIRMLNAFGITPTEELLSRYHVINKSLWLMLERGELTREQVGTRRFELLFSELGIQAEPVQCEQLYRRFLSEGDDVLPGAAEAVAKLHGKYRLFAATNSTVAVQEGRLHHTGLRQYFEDLFISESLEAYKPSVEFFTRAFEKIPCFDPSRALMVGDSLSSDIRGGNNAGIATCWINPKRLPCREGIRVDYEIESIRDLPALLEAL